MSHPDGAGPAGPAEPVEPAGPAGQTAPAGRAGGTTGTGVPLSWDSLRTWLAGALSTACDGELSAREILDSDSSFVAMGITSIATIRLVDAIEAELDIMIDFGGDTWFLQDLNALTAYLTGLTRS
ncbi:phosphopantetheine-binding protein [Streptosporangium sp. OZ121]|uniref:acyl carrier protein n=1 Tax=Streptosporangium sp. OZ121 TaxID=3444183 RepID=UPI003F7AB29C